MMKKFLVVMIMALCAMVTNAETGSWRVSNEVTDYGEHFTLYVCSTFSYALAFDNSHDMFEFCAPYDVFDLNEENETHVLITQYDNNDNVVKQDFITMELTQAEQNALFCFDPGLTNEIRTRLLNGKGSVSICLTDVLDNTIYLKCPKYKKATRQTKKRKSTKKKR